MKSFLGNAVLALTVLGLGAAVRPAFAPAGKTIIAACPVPTCPPGDPNGCGIRDGK